MLTAAIMAGLVLLAAAPAQAQGLPSCEQETMRIKAEHPKVWAQAGDPSVECGSPFVPGGNVGWFDTRANTIRLAGGFDGVYGTAIAHELGHAWQYRAVRRSPGLVESFAVVRGFVNAWSLEAREDYAETFAFSLGEWGTQVEVVAVAPYRFQTVAGVPSEGQLAVLRVSGVLPMVGLGCSSG